MYLVLQVSPICEESLLGSLLWREIQRGGSLSVYYKYNGELHYNNKKGFIYPGQIPRRALIAGYIFRISEYLEYLGIHLGFSIRSRISRHRSTPYAKPGTAVKIEICHAFVISLFGLSKGLFLMILTQLSPLSLLIFFVE